MQIARLSAAVGLVSLLGVLRLAPQELDARQILERTAKVYSECKTYRDSGVAKTYFMNNKNGRMENKPFTTAFVRPDRFRYEFLSRRAFLDSPAARALAVVVKIPNQPAKEQRYLVWKNGKDVRTWWDIQPGVEENDSLDSALGAAIGVSGRTSYTVPDLLMDLTQGFRRVTDLEDPVRKPDADLHGTRCFVVEGQWQIDPATLWIDQRTFLIRRIDSGHTFDDFRTESITTYEPAIDEEIPESLLVFDPPETNKR